MDKIALNFVPLLKQNSRVTVYRRCVQDNTKKKNSKDFRVRLPKQVDDTEWHLFDVSIIKKNGYEAYEFEYLQNSVLAVYLIYQEILKTLDSQNKAVEYYIPEKTVALKDVHFVTDKFVEGDTEFIVKPYFLKRQQKFGFLVEHKFALKDDQPYNRQTQIKSLSLDRSGRPNIYFYKDKRETIENFIKKILSPLLVDSNIPISIEFSLLPAKQLDAKTYLVGGKKAVRSPFLGIKANGPYRQVTDDIRYLFIFTERTRSLARYIYLGLIGKLFPAQFSGLESMFSIPLHKDNVDHQLLSMFDNKAIRTSENRVRKIKESYPNSKVMVVAVLPKGFKCVHSAFDAYGHLKLLALRNDVFCQIITEDTFFKKDQLQWSISNIGLQIFSKLGGTPWLVRPAKTDCLIFGIGNVQERVNDSIIKYAAYTVCLDSSGDFKYIKPLSSSNKEGTYLSSLKAKLKEVLLSELDGNYKSFVLHLPYKISWREIDVIKSVVSEIADGTSFEVIVIRVNTRHKFLGFSDHNTCVPYESAYLPISDNEFLVWTDGLQYDKGALHKRVAEPLYVDFIASHEEWTTKKECLQDILNLAGANWRGFNSTALPISILYSRLIAKFMKNFSHFENVNYVDIVGAKSTTPWFL